MIDIYEMEKCKVTGKWQTQHHRLLAIRMSFESAKILFKQHGILACEYKFKSLHRQLHGVFPKPIRAIALMHGNLYALADHDEVRHSQHPEPEIFERALRR